MDFDWDVGNIDHISTRTITPTKVEQAIQDLNQIEARSYSLQGERRQAITGMAEDGDLLFVVYTEREGRIRPLSARRANRQERKEYEGWR